MNYLREIKMSKKKEFDAYKDYKYIETLDCPYCGKSKLEFKPATGYESHFWESYFVCRKCYRSYPMDSFLRCPTFKDVENLVEKMGDGWRVSLSKALEEKWKAYQDLLDIIKLDKKFNPSRRVGKNVKI